MDFTVEIHCGKCGSANYSLAGHAAAAGKIACNDCGHFMGTVADLQDELVEQVVAQSAEARRERLGQVNRDGPADVDRP